MPFSKVSIRGARWLKDPSGIHVLHADEPQALVMAAGYLKFTHAQDNGEGIYLRGQRKLYGSLVPSLYRNVATQVGRAKGHASLADVVDQYRESGKIFGGFGSYAHEPLLQHYGVSTTWIDLVDNVWVALWFACHQARIAGKRHEFLHFEARQPDGKDDYAYVLLVGADLTKRDRTKPGYFNGPNTELVDLRVAAPSVFLRPHAQHGLLFRKKGVPGGNRAADYADQIRGVIRVDLSRAVDWLGQGRMTDVHSLFPPPYYDCGYQILLDAGVAGGELTGVVWHIGA